MLVPWLAAAILPVFGLGHTGQIPFAHNTKTAQPYDLYAEHFSLNATHNQFAFYDGLKRLFPDQQVTMTTDRRFQPEAFAAEKPERLLFRKNRAFKSIDEVFFVPQKRKVGDGFVVDSSSLAAYDVGYGAHELLAVVISYPAGYGVETLWSLIGDKHAAREIIRETISWSYEVQDAVLVYDKYWQQSRALYEAIQKDSLQKDYRAFFKAEKVYKDLGVPWKRGLILAGPPGNGKTISLKAIAKEIDHPTLYVKSFHGWSGDEQSIREVFQRAREQAPCLLILEDLDSLITDENRSFFLNEVDGLEDNDGLLIIGTTNHVDRLDPALSSRPSRFDRRYTFSDPKEPERAKYAVYWQRKLSENKDISFPDSLVDEVAANTEHFSFAYLQEAFVAALLTLASGNDGEQTGKDFPQVLLDQIERLRKEIDHDDEEDDWREAYRGWSRPAGHMPWRGGPVETVSSDFAGSHKSSHASYAELKMGGSGRREF